MNATEAETIAMKFIKQKHHGVTRIFFRRMSPEENFWVLHGEVAFKHAHFFPTLRTFKVQINMNTGEVSFYEEARPRNLEKQQETRIS